jgi:hypothetical protein
MIENQGDHTEQFGLYVDIIPPGGVSNPYGCTPNGRIIQTVVTLSPGEKQNVFSAPMTFNCANQAGAAGQTYTIIAVIDVHADDLAACPPSTLMSVSCFNALADDDTDDSDNRRSVNRPKIQS